MAFINLATFPDSLRVQLELSQCFAIACKNLMLALFCYLRAAFISLKCGICAAFISPISFRITNTHMHRI